MNPSRLGNQILLLGHPRCGAHYLAATLSSYNYDIGSDHWGTDGIATWCLAADPSFLQNLKAAYPPGGTTRPFNIDKKRIIHYIRNPIDVLPSLLGTNDPAGYNYRKRILYAKYKVNLDDYNPLDGAAVSFTLWNKMIEEQEPGFVLRVEDSVEPLLQYIQNNFGWNFGIPKLLQESDYCRGTPKKVDWSQLRPDLLQALDNWCFEYGYPELSKSIQNPSISKPAPKIPKAPTITTPTVTTEPVHTNLGVPVQSRRAPAAMHMSKIMGPRNRNTRPTATPTQAVTGVPVEDVAINIRPRLVHHVVVPDQSSVVGSERERQKSAGFSVRGKR